MPEAVRVEGDGLGVKYGLDVTERNYSSGTMKVRLVSSVLGLGFEMMQMDAKTIRTSVIEMSRDGGRFREVDSSQFANDWTYIDAKERP